MAHSDFAADAAGVDSGTTIIAVEFDGGVVLGADSRTSTGSFSPPRASCAPFARARPPLFPPFHPPLPTHPRRLVRCEPCV
jgi:hypothetical protein